MIIDLLVEGNMDRKDFRIISFDKNTEVVIGNLTGEGIINIFPIINRLGSNTLNLLVDLLHTCTKAPG